jgi:homoserine dehydrogenase
VGFGHVGRRFARLLDEQRATIGDLGIDTRIIGVVTRRHGRAYSPRGVDATLFADRVERGESIASPAATMSPGSPRSPGSAAAFIREVTTKSAAAARQRRLVVVETTPLDIARGQPAIGHVRAALDGGAHVITANKGPVAFAYRSLARAADRVKRRFLFEGAVMDGIPIFNLVRETLPAVTITGFRGVVNSTTNYILTAMERGERFDAALASMQRAGIAEADPSFDVDGWDAAAKTAALANVLLAARLTPASVERDGIAGITPQRIAAARAAGCRVKLIASAERSGGTVRARVCPLNVAAGDLLAGLEGQQNAIVFQTDLLGEIAIVQRGSGLTQTAYALLSDLVAIGRQTGSVRRQAHP